MKSLSALTVTTVLTLLIVFVAPLCEGDPSVAANAHPDDSFSATDGRPTPDFSPWPANLQQLTGGDYAIHVYGSGAYADDGVILPAFEVLEERYAAEGREFTVEYWFKLSPGYNSDGRELFDHHQPSNEGFWTAFQNGQLWAGIDAVEGDTGLGAIHIHTGSGFNDGNWHHYAFVREISAPMLDRLCLYLDGVGSCYTDGSKPEYAPVSADIRPPLNRDGNDANNLPLYTIGARVSGAGHIEAIVDELRLSDVARYRGDFTPPTVPFTLDPNTVMLFHFNEGSGSETNGLSGTGGLNLEGALVKDFDDYSFDPLDPGDPTDAAHLEKMWTAGRFVSTLTLIRPNGHEMMLTGSQYQITWWPGISITHVSLCYSTDGFTSISHTIVASMPNAGVYIWMTPITPSTTTRVRVADAIAPSIYDDSDANFILTDIIYYIYLPVILKNGP
jgi:hypothetical protein